MFDNLYQPDLALGFIWTVILTFYLLVRAIDRKVVERKHLRLLVIVLIGLLAVQGLVSVSGFYKDFSNIPPRFVLAPGPSVLAVLFIVIFKPAWLRPLSLKRLTWLHVVRVFVELVLLGLYYDKQIPQQMTFAGTNFDILSGLTAPVVAWTCFRGGTPKRIPLIIWNVACLGLLINIVGTALLSAPTPFQQLNFSMPNVGLAYFPFIWLPVFVVPAVLFSHLAALRMLISKPGDMGSSK